VSRPKPLSRRRLTRCVAALALEVVMLKRKVSEMRDAMMMRKAWESCGRKEK
jgi:hypothetical protein